MVEEAPKRGLSAAVTAAVKVRSEASESEWSVNINCSDRGVSS
jgi:hypothetical protein